jgi:hypothetical protein
MPVNALVNFPCALVNASLVPDTAFAVVFCIALLVFAVVFTLLFAAVLLVAVTDLLAVAVGVVVVGVAVVPPTGAALIDGVVDVAVGADPVSGLLACTLASVLCELAIEIELFKPDCDCTPVCAWNCCAEASLEKLVDVVLLVAVVAATSAQLKLDTNEQAAMIEIDFDTVIDFDMIVSSRFM